MPKNKQFKCDSCGNLHKNWPALAFSSPDNYDGLSEEDKKNIGYLDSDFCIIHHEDQTDRFIRCTLVQKVNDHCEDLDYGLWVSLSEKSYLDYKENFRKDSEEKVYFGWLCNDVLGYEFSESIPMNVVTRKNGLRPELFPHESFEHPFVRDFYDGILKATAEKRISEMLEITMKTEDKKWWQVWRK